MWIGWILGDVFSKSRQLMFQRNQPDSNRARLRLTACLGGLLVVLLLSPARSLAAGCHLSAGEFSQSFDGRLFQHQAQWSWWTSGKVNRLYEHGRFTYYSIPSDHKPCNGPSCEGSTPQTSLTPVSTIESNRTNWELLRSRNLFEPMIVSIPMPPLAASQYKAPVLSGPLRPPTL